MSGPLVIARDAFGQPLKRIVISGDNNLFYLANPSRIDAVERGESFPVGFPRIDVFALNNDVFKDLEMEWRSSAKTDLASWGKLKRFNG